MTWPLKCSACGRDYLPGSTMHPERAVCSTCESKMMHVQNPWAEARNAVTFTGPWLRQALAKAAVEQDSSKPRWRTPRIPLGWQLRGCVYVACGGLSDALQIALDRKAFALGVFEAAACRDEPWAALIAIAAILTHPAPGFPAFDPIQHHAVRLLVTYVEANA